MIRRWQLTLLTSKFIKLKPAVDKYNSVIYSYTSLIYLSFFSTSPTKSFWFFRKLTSLSTDRVYKDLSDIFLVMLTSYIYIHIYLFIYLYITQPV